MFNISSGLNSSLDYCTARWGEETKILRPEILSVTQRITKLKRLMRLLWLDKLSLCTISWTINEWWHVFVLRSLWNKSIDEMKESLFHKTFLYAQYPIELFPNSSILKEYCIHVHLLWVPIRTCNKNNIHKGKSYECILQISIWLVYIFCTVWISCSFQKTLLWIFNIFLRVFIIGIMDNMLIDTVSILLKFMDFLFINRFIFWS